MISREACRGCHDDYYNQPGNTFSGDRCWSAKSGLMMIRYKIGIHSMPATPFAFEQVRKPSCYRQTGEAFYNELPHFVKLDQVIGHARAKRAAAKARTA